MECTLTTLIMCFNWSNLYFDASTDFIHDRNPRLIETFYGESMYVMPTNGGDPFLQRNMVREINRYEREIQSPYGRVAFGYELDLRSLRFDVSAFYQESFTTTDRGEVGGSVKIKWFPFRR